MSMVLFFLYGVSFYFVFRELSTNKLEKDLIIEKEKVLNNPAQYLEILNSNHAFIDHIFVDTINTAHDHKLTFFDSLAFNNSTQVIEPVRCIQFETSVELSDPNQVEYESVFNAGVAFRLSGQLEKAEYYYRRATSIRPEVRTPDLML